MKTKKGQFVRNAKRFKVSPDCVQRLLQRYYQEGTVEPKPYTGGNEPILKSEHLKILITLVEEDNDATLFQLAQRLEAQTQLQVSSSTISRAIAFGTGGANREAQSYP